MKDTDFRYKVVTQNMESLGLRKNPNIMKFVEGKWIELEADQIQYGNGDWGGIWVARAIGGANTLHKYMEEKHHQICLVYKCEIGDVLYENSYRIKTNKVKLVSRIK